MKYCTYCGAALTDSAVSFCPECGKELPMEELGPTPKRLLKRHVPIREQEPDPPDDDYDGYYDDVTPIDNGHVRDKMAPELVKRIIILAASTLVIVILSVILMYLL